MGRRMDFLFTRRTFLDRASRSFPSQKVNFSKCLSRILVIVRIMERVRLQLSTSMELLMDRKGSRILKIVTCVGKRVRLKNVQKKYCQKLKLEMEKREEANKKLENENKDGTKE